MIDGTTVGNHASSETSGVIDVVALGLPVRLRKLRSKKNLTQKQLADAAGLTYRTVHDIESGRRDRIQEQTLLLLAKALDLTYEELIHVHCDKEGSQRGDPATSRRSRRWLGLVVTVLVILAVGWLLRASSASRAQVEVEGAKIIVRDVLIGSELWRSEAVALIGVCERAPWSDRVILLGRRGNAYDGGRLEARKLATGDVIWSFEPDPSPAIASFGTEVMSNGRMGCIWTGPADLDGDGHAELLALFGHSLYYPHCLVRLNERGKVLDTYWCRGAIYHVLALDVDEDGKQEIYLCGTYNSPAYQGATIIVLDEGHFSGVASDPHLGSRVVTGDGSLARAIYPRFPHPVMAALEASRIEIRRLQPQLSDGQIVRFIAKAGEDERDCILTLDRDLRVLDFGISDKMALLCSRLEELPGGLADGNAGWIVPWLRTRVRIVKGVVDDTPDPVFAAAGEH